MEFITSLNFPTFNFIFSDKNDREYRIFFAKASFDILDDGSCVIAEDQEPMHLSDQYLGEVGQSSLYYPSDLVPYKPKLDIILVGDSISPTGEPEKSWDASIKVKDVEMNFKVYGPRYWKPKIKDKTKLQLLWDDREKQIFEGWELTEPEPCLSVPLTYENSFGGELEIQREENEDIYILNEYNPVGCGILHQELEFINKLYKAPQVEYVGNPITEPYESYPSGCPMAIPPHWLPRRPLAGTYDEAWQQNIAPSWPQNYDYLFHNSGAIQIEHLTEETDLHIDLIGYGMKKVSLTIPKVECIFSYGKEFILTAPIMDTVHIDINKRKLQLVWRITFDKDDFSHLYFVEKDSLTLDGKRTQRLEAKELGGVSWQRNTH